MKDESVPASWNYGTFHQNSRFYCSYLSKPDPPPPQQRPKLSQSSDARRIANEDYH